MSYRAGRPPEYFRHTRAVWIPDVAECRWCGRPAGSEMGEIVRFDAETVKAWSEHEACHRQHMSPRTRRIP
jgi:hypothetical protein